jgi:hypothetical protein
MEGMTTAATCTPNFTGPGRRRRLRFAQGALGFSLLLLVGLALTDAPWFARLGVALPAAMGAISFLQVRRNTCVARAAEGTIEHEDFSTTRAPEAELAASRRVAGTIVRDGVLIGATAGALGALSALV